MALARSSDVTNEGRLRPLSVGRGPVVGLVQVCGERWAWTLRSLRDQLQGDERPVRGPALWVVIREVGFGGRKEQLVRKRSQLATLRCAIRKHNISEDGF